MKKLMVIAAALLLLVGASAALAQEGPIETVAKGCQAELVKYCAEVTPGQGRVLSCLYAYGDKLSPKCEFALYDAAVQLERAVAALTFVASECDEDMDKFCASIAPGEGRLLDCLGKNKAKVSKRCLGALQDVGLE